MTITSTRSRRAGLGTLAIGFVVGIAATCAAPSTATTTSGGSASERPVQVRPSSNDAGNGLPTLPPMQDRRPQSFDGAGCRLRGDGSSDCSNTADQIAKGEAGTQTSDWRNLAGFTGRSYTNNLDAQSVVVLTESVSVVSASDGSWRAIGLVRNETDASVPAISVSAKLMGSDGVLLGQATASAAVANVRPGEPVPFEILAPDVPAAMVSGTAWTAGSAEPVDPASGSRAFEIATYWTRPSGGRPIESDLHRDGGTPADHLVFGSVTNVGAASTGTVVVHAAWLDNGGKVVAVASDVGRSDSGVASSVAPGGFVDMLLVVSGGDATVVAQITPMMWAVAS